MVFVRDNGLLHALLGIANQRDLELHPKVGASWEGYAVEEVVPLVELTDPKEDAAKLFKRRRR